MRVSRRTYRHIVRGDAARAERRWQDAASYYRQVVAADPDLAHIHIQLGHALKELAQLDEASDAYNAALLTGRDDREALFYLGEVASRRGAFSEAAINYATMLTLDIDDDEAVAQLVRVLRHLGAAERDAVVGIVQDHLPVSLHSPDASSVAAAMGEGATGAASAVSVVFDVSDLVSFFGHARRPTGIQRVQVETVSAALNGNFEGVSVTICCMSESSDDWHAFPPSLLLALVALSGSADAGEAEWRRMRSTLRLALLLAPVVAFPSRTALVNLGASWWLGNYFLALRQAKARSSIAYLPFVHDLIPIFHPEFHTATLIAEFINWLVPAMDHADAFLVNSRATGCDLARARLLTDDRAPNRSTTIVPLDAAFGRAGTLVVDGGEPLIDQAFVLFVGTIEPRKGHAAALDAWSLLLNDRGSVPLLVCVGRMGWDHGPILARLDDAALRARVVILSDIDDDALNALYRGALFTLYPSLYEGWGLPVTEALSRGKVVVTTNSSALPEAGGDLALYVPPDDPAKLAATVRALLDEPDRLARLEARIAATFRPRSWQAIARQVIDIAVDAAFAPPRDHAPTIPRAVAWQFYSPCRIDANSLTPGLRAGEGFRTGVGWQWPERWGCRICGRADAGLAFRPVRAEQPVRTPLVVLLLIRGVEAHACPWRVTALQGSTREGVVAASSCLWVEVETCADKDGVVHLAVAGVCEPEQADDGSPRLYDPDFVGNTIGVDGFFFVGTSDDDGIAEAKARLAKDALSATDALGQSRAP